MIFVAGYGCTTAAGKGVAALWNGACDGRDFSRTLTMDDGAEIRACLWSDHDSHTPVQEKLLAELHLAWVEARGFLPGPLLGRVGVVLASTKGFVEDVIWLADPPLEADFIAPILDRFVHRAELAPVRRAAISNACASSLSALWLAEKWLRGDIVDHVVLLACDAVGPFVMKGFHSLQALTPTRVKPFAEDRNGLQLGEAAVAMILSTRKTSNLIFCGAGVDAVGNAVTRPSPSSLSRAIEMLDLKQAPPLILAHGTGTLLNDQAEDQVFSQIFGNRSQVTASKWSIGHTLGASGLLDAILSGEMLRQRQAFGIANTPKVDPAFRANYLTTNEPLANSANQALITSLGFGGIHAAALFERPP